MYNTKEAITQSSNESKYLSAGIHDNVMLSSIRIDKSPTGNSFLEIGFTKDNQEVLHTEWEPKAFPNQTSNTVKDSINVNSLYDFDRACNRQLSRLLQIIGCYYKEDELDFTCNTFDELTKWVKDKLQPVIDNTVTNVPVRLKVVFNKRGFTTLPSYAKYTFIEPMSVTESKIEKLNIDLYERPIQADKEPVSATATTTDTVATSTSADKLPF